MEALNDIQATAKAAIAACNELSELEQLRVEYLGKKGKLTEFLKNLGNLPVEQRPEAGKQVNILKQELHGCIEAQRESLQAVALEAKIKAETIDVTLPGKNSHRGALHPVTRARERIEKLFAGLGFTIVEGPEIETEYYNFDALNIPSHHPARAMHDTFYFADGQVLRTHTSPVQIRHMEKQAPPIRMLAPGRVYRCDSDVTHTPMFHQVEGLVIDKDITMADLKGMLLDFAQQFFEQELKIRFRPSYFPFTEPSAEADIQCVMCQGKGCRVCSYTGWLEVLGCGMVHPNVLEAGNIDSEEYTGFAFGLGIDRMAMLRYGIDDLRILFENDIRLLEQF